MQPVMTHSIPMLAPPIAPPPSVASVPRGRHIGLQAPSPDSVPQAIFPSSMGELNPDAPSFVPQYFQGGAAQSAAAASQILPESDPPLRIEEFDALLSQATKQGLGGDAAARTPPAHPPGLQARQMPPNLGLHPDRSMMADRSMMYPPHHYPRLPPHPPLPPSQAAQGPPHLAQPTEGPPPRTQLTQGPSPPTQPTLGTGAPTQPSSSSSGGGVRLFEDRWSEQTVPENVKELWVPPQQVPHPHMYVTVPPTSPPTFAATVPRRHPTPHAFPVELNSPGNPGSEAMKNIRTPSTAVPDSPPFLSSPTPYRGYPANHGNPPANPIAVPPLKPPAPAREPSIDLGLATRTLLLKYRTSMGKFPAPWELKIKYKLVDGSEVKQEEDNDEAAEANPTAGATLLKFVKGEASMSEVVGKAQGEELLQFLKGDPSEKTKENEDLNVFHKLIAQPEQREPETEHHVWALNKILTTKLPAEERRWNQAQINNNDRQSWQESYDDNTWNWKSARRRPIQQDSWHTWNSDDSWTEYGDKNSWPWDGRDVCRDFRNGLPEGVHEARRYKDGNMYVVVDGQWLKASAQYYCASCQLFGNKIFEHLESNHHKRNVGRFYSN